MITTYVPVPFTHPLYRVLPRVLLGIFILISVLTAPLNSFPLTNPRAGFGPLLSNASSLTRSTNTGTIMTTTEAEQRIHRRHHLVVSTRGDKIAGGERESQDNEPGCDDGENLDCSLQRPLRQRLVSLRTTQTLARQSAPHSRRTAREVYHWHRFNAMTPFECREPERRLTTGIVKACSRTGLRMRIGGW